MQLQARNFTETMTFGRNSAVSINGGYKCDFGQVIGSAIIHGCLTVGGGSLTLSNIVLQ